MRETNGNYREIIVRNRMQVAYYEMYVFYFIYQALMILMINGELIELIA